MYTYIRTRTHTHLYTNTPTPTHPHTYTHTPTHTYTHTHTPTHLHTHTHTHTYTHTPTHTHTHTLCVCMYICQDCVPEYRFVLVLQLIVCRSNCFTSFRQCYSYEMHNTNLDQFLNPVMLFVRSSNANDQLCRLLVNPLPTMGHICPNFIMLFVRQTIIMRLLKG